MIPPENPLGDGQYDVVVMVTDIAGNSSFDSSAAEIIVDTSAPSTPSVALDLAAASDSGESASDDITNLTD